MADNAYERLMASDEVWFPEGQPIGAAHDEIVGRPVDLSHEISDNDVAFGTQSVTGADGKVSIEYISQEDQTSA